MLLLRSARTLVRVQAALVLVLLIVAAAAVNVTAALRLRLPITPAAVGVAVAPWVMLAVALWLWLLLIKHVQARRPPPTRTTVRPTGHRALPTRAVRDRDGATARPGTVEGPPPLVTPADAVPPPRRATPPESTPVGARRPRRRPPAHLGAGHPLARRLPSPHRTRAPTTRATRNRHADPSETSKIRARRHCGSGI